MKPEGRGVDEINKGAGISKSWSVMDKTDILFEFVSSSIQLTIASYG